MSKTRIYAALFSLALVGAAVAQQSNPGVQQSGTVTSGHGVVWGPGVGQVQDGGAFPVGTIGSQSLSSSGSVTVGGTSPCTGPICAFTVNLPALVTGATIGSATVAPVITFDNFGRATSIGTAAIAPPFAAITGSLACGQMPALTGDTTSSAGSCANVNVKLNGISFAAAAAADTVPVITTANTTATYTALPNCTAGVLQYATATHLFSCGAAGAGTVTSVATAGLASGGPITGTGTVTVTAATKADQQTGTSAVVAVTPSQQQSHDSAAKAWASFTGSTGAIQRSFNVTSISRSSAGIYVITFTTAFADALYACNITGEQTSTITTSGFLPIIQTNGRTPTTLTLFFAQAFNTSPTAADPLSGHVVCYGRQ